METTIVYYSILGLYFIFLISWSWNYMLIAGDLTRCAATAFLFLKASTAGDATTCINCQNDSCPQQLCTTIYIIQSVAPVLSAKDVQ